MGGKIEAKCVSPPQMRSRFREMTFTLFLSSEGVGQVIIQWFTYISEENAILFYNTMAGP